MLLLAWSGALQGVLPHAPPHKTGAYVGEFSLHVTAYLFVLGVVPGHNSSHCLTA